MKNNFVSEKNGCRAKSLLYAKCVMPWEHVSWRNVGGVSAWARDELYVCVPACMSLSVCQLGLMWLPRGTWGRPI